MIIRAAKLTDLKEIKAIDEALFGAETYPLFVLRQLFDIPGSMLYVADADNRVVAYTLGSCCQESGIAWFLSLGVLPEYRSQGIGEKLLRLLIEEVESKSVQQMYLTVHPDNSTGIKLYKRLGFKISGTDDDYYLDGQPRLIMVRLNA